MALYRVDKSIVDGDSSSGGLEQLAGAAIDSPGMVAHGQNRRVSGGYRYDSGCGHGPTDAHHAFRHTTGRNANAQLSTCSHGKARCRDWSRSLRSRCWSDLLLEQVALQLSLVQWRRRGRIRSRPDFQSPRDCSTASLRCIIRTDKTGIQDIKP